MPAHAAALSIGMLPAARSSGEETAIGVEEGSHDQTRKMGPVESGLKSQSYVTEENLERLLEGSTAAARQRPHSLARGTSALILSAACLCLAVLFVSQSEESARPDALTSWSSLKAPLPPTFQELKENRANVRAAEKSLADQLYDAEAKEEKAQFSEGDERRKVSQLESSAEQLAAEIHSRQSPRSSLLSSLIKAAEGQKQMLASVPQAASVQSSSSSSPNGMHLSLNGLGQSSGPVNVNIYMPGAQNDNVGSAVQQRAPPQPPRASAPKKPELDSAAVAKELQEQDRKIDELLEAEKRREQHDQLMQSSAGRAQLRSGGDGKARMQELSTGKLEGADGGGAALRQQSGSMSAKELRREHWKKVEERDGLLLRPHAPTSRPDLRAADRGEGGASKLAAKDAGRGGKAREQTLSWDREKVRAAEEELAGARRESEDGQLRAAEGSTWRSGRAEKQGRREEAKDEAAEDAQLEQLAKGGAAGARARAALAKRASQEMRGLEQAAGAAPAMAITGSVKDLLSGSLGAALDQSNAVNTMTEPQQASADTQELKPEHRVREAWGRPLGSAIEASDDRPGKAPEMSEVEEANSRMLDALQAAAMGGQATKKAAPKEELFGDEDAAGRSTHAKEEDLFGADDQAGGGRAKAHGSDWMSDLKTEERQERAAQGIDLAEEDQGLGGDRDAIASSKGGAKAGGSAWLSQLTKAEGQERASETL